MLQGILIIVRKHLLAVRKFDCEAEPDRTPSEWKSESLVAEEHPKCFLHP
jgi:hypothetical protein